MNIKNLNKSEILQKLSEKRAELESVIFDICQSTNDPCILESTQSAIDRLNDLEKIIIGNSNENLPPIEFPELFFNTYAEITSILLSNSDLDYFIDCFFSSFFFFNRLFCIGYLIYKFLHYFKFI